MGLLPYWERTHLKSARPSNMSVPLGVFVTRERDVDSHPAIWSLP
jgi:hypothetical protein